MLKSILIGALFLLAPAMAHAQDAQNVPAACSYDWSALMALDLQHFDQDPAGWRQVAEAPGCERAAAGLIADYRDSHAVRLVDGSLSDLKVLDWHQAQLLATAGDTAAATELFTRAGPGLPGDGWDYYSDATVAFLQGRRDDLLKARASLAALPQPAWFAKLAASNTNPQLHLVWPENLDVVDGLIACFGKPYREAYGTSCRDLAKQPH